MSWLHRLGDRLSPKVPITAEATPISPAVLGVIFLGVFLLFVFFAIVVIFVPTVEQRKAAERGETAATPEPYKPRIASIGERIGLVPLNGRTDGPIVVWKSFADQEEGSALAKRCIQIPPALL